MNYRFNNTVKIAIDKIELVGELIIPLEAESLILFCHGSGSSRFSPRNNFVAREFHKKNIGTFLFDLLTNEEDLVYENRFNIELLTERLIAITKHISQRKECANLNIGYFGASTGAASAFKAAVALPDLIHAIVSRGGRPDLAIDVASKIKAPTLLIVGELDYKVIELNQAVYKVMKCEKEIKIVNKATHLFEEEGALQAVTSLAVDWFETYLKIKTHVQNEYK
jgi:putative phosphoribosyl transferase